MILSIIYLLIVSSLSVVLHELGHIVTLKNYTGKTPVLRFIKREGLCVGYPEDYKGLSKQEYRNVMWVGIGMGIIPIFFFLNGIAFWLMIPIYLIGGCHSDFKNIWRRRE